MAAFRQWGNPPGGGKSGLHGNTVPVNGRRGRPQGKCHREQTAVGLQTVRVTGCGKSAPHRRYRRWHGKPHREQDRIGTARERKFAGGFLRCCPGRSRRGVRRRAPQMNGYLSSRFRPGRGQNPAYRPSGPKFVTVRAIGPDSTRTPREICRKMARWSILEHRLRIDLLQSRLVSLFPRIQLHVLHLSFDQLQRQRARYRACPA